MRAGAHCIITPPLQALLELPDMPLRADSRTIREIVIGSCSPSRPAYWAASGDLPLDIVTTVFYHYWLIKIHLNFAFHWRELYFWNLRCKVLCLGKLRI